MIPAKHKDGCFTWGGDLTKEPGRWVKICGDCREALSMDGFLDGARSEE
jgi:hypothetical protein